ncbi:FkbM family methyltransferase [Oceanicella sp. SM1341]|uniref:FkbM family methyltransferase n=1 Tax=Oceanicella sp. SM1341 TaxID=1548889 RepID=UPI00130050C4|nr:FkbM family methyltransferase [Oceanicella sp. SM1341]
MRQGGAERAPADMAGQMATRLAGLHEAARLLDREGEPVDSPLRLALAERLQDMFAALLEQEPVASTLEIGAFEAGMSRRALALRPDLAAYALEANPHVYARFARDAIRARVRYIHAAAAGSIGTARLRIPRAIDGRGLPPVNPIGSLCPRAQGEVRYEEVTVSTIPLNALRRMYAIPAPHALWIDVEGAQMQVIRGGGRVLADTAILFIELESFGYWREGARADEVTEALAQAGLFPVARDFEAPGQFNVIFARHEVIERRAELLDTGLGHIEALLAARPARAAR